MILTITEFADKIGEKRDTIYRMYKRGLFNGIQLPTGKVLLYDVEDEEVRELKKMLRFFKDGKE